MEFVELALETTSLEEQRAFYGDVLGLPVAAEAPGEFTVQAGRSRLTFRTASAVEAPSYHFAFRIPGDCFVEAKAWLSERTELLRDGEDDEFPWTAWRSRAVYANDPAGNVIELIAFDNLDHSDEGRFRANSILAVAEVGLPVRDVNAAATAFDEAFGIGLWDRNQAGTQFMPIGERGSTFIVVPLGRAWYLGDAAAAHPIKVVVGGVPEREFKLAEHPYSIRGVD